MRVLIIGGSGFLGQYLSEVLVEKHRCDVIATHRRELICDERKKGVTFYNLDLNQSSETLKQLLFDVDAVVVTIKPNIIHTQRVLEAIKSCHNLKKIVYLSTIMVYPDSTIPQDENIKPNVLTEYEKIKVEEEKLFRIFVKDSDYELCITRLGNVYGDLKDQGIINYIIKALLEGSKLTVNGDGSIVRDYIHIDDASMLLSSLVTRSQSEKVSIYNVSSGKGYSINRLIKFVELQNNSKLSVFNGPSIYEKKSVIGNNLRLVNLLKRQPYYNLETGLLNTLKKYQGEKTI